MKPRVPVEPYAKLSARGNIGLEAGDIACVTKDAPRKAQQQQNQDTHLALLQPEFLGGFVTGTGRRIVGLAHRVRVADTPGHHIKTLENLGGMVQRLRRLTLPVSALHLTHSTP